MDYPLTLPHILERSAKLFPRKSIASKMPDGMERYCYADFHRRVHALAQSLKRFGIRRGDRVGTLCWNSFRHLELYFAVPCYGAVLHTLNLRLHPDELAFIVNDADDAVVLVDETLLPLWEKIAPQTRVRQAVVVGATTSHAGYLDYEAVLSRARGQS